MVIGLLALTAIPTTTGVAFATSEQRKANQRKEDARRMLKFNIDAECDGDTDDDRDVHGRRVVVRDNKVRTTPANTIHASCSNLSNSQKGLPGRPKPTKPYHPRIHLARLLHRVPRTRGNKTSEARTRSTHLRSGQPAPPQLDLRGQGHARTEIRESDTERGADR